MMDSDALLRDDQETGRTWSQGPGEHVAHLLPFLVNRTLNRGDEARVNAHLSRCPTCRAELQEWRSIATAAASLPASPAPTRLPNRIMDVVTSSHAASPIEGDFSPDAQSTAETSVHHDGVRTASPLSEGNPPGSRESLPRPPDLIDVHDAASQRMLKERMEDVLGTLSAREREVLVMRFGLEDGRGKTLEEVGREFGVTRERIRQIEAKALRKLRHPSRARRPEDYPDL